MQLCRYLPESPEQTLEGGVLQYITDRAHILTSDSFQVRWEWLHLLRLADPDAAYWDWHLYT